MGPRGYLRAIRGPYGINLLFFWPYVSIRPNAAIGRQTDNTISHREPLGAIRSHGDTKEVK